MQPAEQTPRARLFTIIGFVLAAWVAFAFAFTPLRTSHDEFWHLKTGKWISEHGRLPENDIFTYTAEYIPWHNHEWLTQLVMWWIYRWGEEYGFGGWRAVILFKTIVIILTFAGFGLLLARRMTQPVWAALAAAMMVALARRTFYPRPPFITYLLLAITLWVLIEWRAGRLRRWTPWTLPPLFALWANLHGGWQAGLILIGAFWVDSILEWFQLRNAECGMWNAEFRISRLGQISLLLGACTLATLVNPYGFRLYELAGRVMADKYLWDTIGELKPPDWFFVWILEGTILTMAAAAIRPVSWRGFGATVVLLIVLHFILRATSNPWLHTAIALPVFAAAIWRVHMPGWFAHLLIVLFFAYQGIHHVRHLPLMAIVMLPAVAWALEGWALAAQEAWSGRMPEARAKTLVTHAVFWTLFVFSVYWIFYGQAWRPVWPWLGHEGYSHLERNLMLARGIETGPKVVDTKHTKWLIPSTLPQGAFLVEEYPRPTVDFLIRAKLPAPLWNGGNYAGYLIWRLAPERYKVFTDNRYDIFGGLVIRQEHAVLDGYDEQTLAVLQQRRPDFFKGPPPPPWNKVLDQWNAQTLFIPADAPVNIRLNQGGWVRVWEDYNFNLWVRDTPENKEVIQRALEMERPLPVEAVLGQ